MLQSLHCAIAGDVGETPVTSARPEEHRAEFIGELRTSRVTGQPERSGGKWWDNVKKIMVFKLKM